MEKQFLYPILSVDWRNSTFFNSSFLTNRERVVLSCQLVGRSKAATNKALQEAGCPFEAKDVKTVFPMIDLLGALARKKLGVDGNFTLFANALKKGLHIVVDETAISELENISDEVRIALLGMASKGAGFAVAERLGIITDTNRSTFNSQTRGIRKKLGFDMLPLTVFCAAASIAKAEWGLSTGAKPYPNTFVQVMDMSR